MPRTGVGRKKTPYAVFRCDGFKCWCRRKTIRVRYGAVGRHGSIAVIERFIKTLKDEVRSAGSGVEERAFWPEDPRNPCQRSRQASIIVFVVTT